MCTIVNLQSKIFFKYYSENNVLNCQQNVSLSMNNKTKQNFCCLVRFFYFFFRFDYFRFISFRFSFSRYSRWRRNQVLFLLNVFLNDYKKLMAGLLEINERLCDSFSRASCKTETNETSLTDGDTHMVHLYAAGAMFRQGQYILKEFLTKRIKAFWKIRSNRKIL